MDFTLSPSLQRLRDTAVDVALAAARGLDDITQRENSWIVGYSADFARELGEQGWIGMTWPVEEGGHGRTPLERFVVYEALIEHGAPIAAMWFADRQMGPSMLQFGTSEQRRRFLPGIVARTSMWCIGITIMGGTDEILRNILGERVLGLPQEPRAPVVSPERAG